jgi:hypothetical protein
MSDSSTTRMIDAYMEEAEAPLFLSGFFQSSPRNFHSSEKVEIDIVRSDESIAIAVQSIKSGARQNEETLYQNKAFTPPVFREEYALSAYDLGNRRPGVDPYTDPDFGANATVAAFRKMRLLEDKVRRSVELMCSQVLQTGAVTLTDSAGVAVYELDYGARPSHILTVGTTWHQAGSSGNPLLDLENLAIEVRRDGKKQPNKLIFGTAAWRAFKANALVQAAFDKEVFNLAAMAPASRGQGATFMARVWIGAYLFECWVYDGFFKHPQTGVLTSYVDEDNVIMLSEGGRLDLSWGAIPRIVAPDQRALSFLPGRMSSSERGLDLNPYAWLSANGNAVMLEVAARPLAIPTAIDTYACLTTVSG